MAEHFTIHFLSDPALFREKEKIYLEVRRREGRVFPDEVVRNLPFVSKSNPYAKEWVWRRRTFERFLSFCKNLPDTRFLHDSKNGSWIDSFRMTKKTNILDLGCGNGWLANRLAENPDWDVWAADVNETELAQGARLFGRENLRFVYADLSTLVSRNDIPGDAPGISFRDTFDLVVLAASVQYFPDLEQLIFSLKKCLKPGGEIHILDSPFYKNEEERKAARQRTLEYYTKIGAPKMATFYHHHLWADVERLGGSDLNNRLGIKILQKIKWLAPFPWVRVKMVEGS